MSREINFETAFPKQIADLESGILRFGARAHKGKTGYKYKCGELVNIGPLTKGDEQVSLYDVRFVRHTHNETEFEQNGVPVEVVYLTPEENDAVNDL